MDLTSLITSIILLFFVTHIPKYVSSSSGCSVSRCGYSRLPDIRFPFRLKDSEQPINCGYPGFDVSCDYMSKQTLINLQGLGNLYIKNIDYGAQEIWVNDPNNCLPQKLLNNFNLSNTPFSGIYHRSFDFFNCTSMIETHTLAPINCLRGTNYFVYATPSNGSVSPPHTCAVIASMVMVPVQWPALLRDNATNSTLLQLNEDLRLSWFMPECQPCELNGHMCGLKTNSSGSRVIVCSNIPSNNDGKKVEKLSVTTFITVVLIICSPSIIFLLAYLYIWVRARYEDRTIRGPIVTQRPAQLAELGLEEFNVEFARQVILLGLQSSELQPNIVLSEIEETGLSPIREGEKNACTICMVEYQVKDQIGNLPTCGHYFHVDCINKWLLQWPGIIARACPICRTRVD